MTNREYRVRLAWLEQEIEQPNPSDYYLMQIAQEVRRVLSKKPNQIKLKHFRLKFDKETVENKEAKARQSKNTWMSILGVKEETDD